MKVSPGTTSRVHAALPQAPPATLSASVAGPVARDCGSGLHRSGALQRTYRVVAAAAPRGQRSASFLFVSSCSAACQCSVRGLGWARPHLLR